MAEDIKIQEEEMGGRDVVARYLTKYKTENEASSLQGQKRKGNEKLI